MSQPFRHAVATMALAAALPAQADSAKLGDLLSADRLANVGATWVLASLRGMAQVTYVDMHVQPLRGRLVLTGVTVSPYDAPAARDCTVAFDRAIISSAELGQAVHAALDLDLLGIDVSRGCLDRDSAAMLAEFGLDDIAIDRATVTVDYTYASGALEVDATMIAADLADIHANVLFDYFAIDAESEVPIADLTQAQISLVDRGLVANLAPLLPPEAQDAGALARLLGAMLLPEPPPNAQTGDPDPGSGTRPKSGAADKNDDADGFFGNPIRLDPKTAAVNLLIEDTATELARFVNDPGQLRLRLAPETPRRLGPDIAVDLAEFVNAFRPEITTAGAPVVARVSANDLTRLHSWLDGRDGLTEDAAAGFARAFLTGIGAPRDRALGAEILARLLRTDNPEATALALEHLPVLDPATGYRIVWQAAAAGDRQAFAHLDALERRLPAATLIEIQDAARTPREALHGLSAAALHDRGLAALTGLGAPRNYGDAYLLGLLASASGAQAAVALIDDVEEIAQLLAAADDETWPSHLADIRAEARAIWFAPAPK